MGYLEERNHLGAVAEHLAKMQVPYQFKDIGDQEGDIFPAIVCTYRCNNLEFDVILYNIKKWIHVKCMILDLIPFSSEELLSLYEIVLGLNYELPEVTFSLHNKKLYLEIDCLIGIDFDDFEGEFNSIGEGIDSLMSFLLKVSDISLKGTLGRINTNEPSIRK